MQTPEEIEKLNAALKSGDPLNIEQLAWHCGVSPKNAPAFAKAFGLEPDIGRRYPWRRIWRHIHRTEGTQLAGYLAILKERHPSSMIFGGIEDLEAALRVPLIDFAIMAERLGEKPDTLAKSVRQGRVILPFPIIKLGPRKRHFRPLEVQLWVEEEIRLDLPKPPSWTTDQKETNEPTTSVDPATADEASTPVDPATKVVFGQFASDSRNNPT